MWWSKFDRSCWSEDDVAKTVFWLFHRACREEDHVAKAIFTTNGAQLPVIYEMNAHHEMNAHQYTFYIINFHLIRGMLRQPSSIIPGRIQHLRRTSGTPIGQW